MPVTSDGVVWVVWVVWVGQVLLAGRAAAKLLMAIPHHSGEHRIPRLYHCIPVPYHRVPCHRVPYHTVPCRRVPYHTVP